MTRTQLVKMAAASLCALVACSLPQELGKTQEIGVPVMKPAKAVQALVTPKVQLAAALEPAAVTAPVQAPQPVSTPAPAAPVASSYDGSGDWALDWIAQHESSGNQYAVNSIGACGLYQALPCSKMGCALSDAACQTEWARGYAIARYGSTAAAQAFWVANRYW